MEKNKKKEMNVPKNYIETKKARAMCVLLNAKKLSTDPTKLMKFISENRTYFPEVSDELLASFPKSDDKVPVFVELNYEKKFKN